MPAVRDGPTTRRYALRPASAHDEQALASAHDGSRHADGHGSAHDDAVALRAQNANFLSHPGTWRDWGVPVHASFSTILATFSEARR